MKILNGKELALYIKERQARDVRRIKSELNLTPRLAILVSTEDKIISTYINLKKKYGRDIGVTVDVLHVSDEQTLIDAITKLNDDESVNGIIVQLPVGEGIDPERVLYCVKAEKDVDGLGEGSIFRPATPLAIEWLLSGYNVDLKLKKIAIVGNGRLVGEPLSKEFQLRGYDLEVIDNSNKNKLEDVVRAADVVISATGTPRLIKSGFLKSGVVAIDAGVAMEKGQTVGDFDEKVYLRDDVAFTPRIGGVGPVTVSALFENLIKSVSIQNSVK